MLNNNEKYLSRGKSELYNKWVVGYYVKMPPLQDETHFRHVIITEGGIHYKVDPNTVGRCMNIHDKDGCLIFEDDILAGEETMVTMVRYNGHCTTNSWKNKLTYVAELTPSNLQLLSVKASSCRVVGNIHDDPKLVDSKRREIK